MSRRELQGALVLALGLALGGVIRIAGGQFGLRTPGLLSESPLQEEARGSLIDDHVTASDAQGAFDTPRPFKGQQEDDGLLRDSTIGFRGRRLGPVDLNNASAGELEALPGVGPALSRRIVELRRKKGGAFLSIDELLEVKGIGPSKLTQIRASATLGIPGETAQKSVFRKSTSTQSDSSSLQR